jgi:hypothetical protein
MKYVGWALLIAGAAGAYYRYTVYQGAAQGNPALVNNTLAVFDPATYMGLQPAAGSGLIDVPMGADIAVIALGAWLVARG